jgi:hypothetical protein
MLTTPARSAGRWPNRRLGKLLLLIYLGLAILAVTLVILRKHGYV